MTARARPGDGPSRGLNARLLALLDQPAIFNLSQLAISGGQRATKRWAADWLDPRPGEHLLDVCCGTGEYCAVWAEESGSRAVGQSGSEESGVGGRKTADGPAYLGIDLNARYIAYARKRYGDGGGREFRALDATRLSLPAGSFDKALFANSLHHFPDELNRGILREIARVLRPGGRLVLVDMVGDHPGHAQRFFLDRDRGRYLRPLDRQLALLAEHFAIERSATFDAGFTPQTIVAATPRAEGGG
jgi:demethylmenaquinone methyltransferase/2-methoxy-6-polyprenyl-1,4-benzoquinol methylase